LGFPGAGVAEKNAKCGENLGFPGPGAAEKMLGVGRIWGFLGREQRKKR